VTRAAELSGCDYSAEAEIRRPEGEGEMMRPWTDDEMHRLRVLAKGKVSAYYIAKSLGRMAGSVKLKARSLGLILYKKAKAKGK
jgi:hypothetical protein